MVVVVVVVVVGCDATEISEFCSVVDMSRAVVLNRDRDEWEVNGTEVMRGEFNVVGCWLKWSVVLFIEAGQDLCFENCFS